MQTTFPAETDANLEKWNEGHKEQAATQELGEKNLKRQAKVVEEKKAAEINNQVQTAKNSPEEQQNRAAAALKEVAEMQQKCSDSVKVSCSYREHKSGREHSLKTESRTHGKDMHRQRRKQR